jgi:hypothetical protein
MFRKYLLVAVGIFGLALGCGSSGSDDSSGGGGSGGSGSSGSQSTMCDPVAFATINSANSNAKVCSAFVQCLGSKCGDKAKECAGPDYASGKYTGTCAAYYDCVKTCQCEKTCVGQCKPDSLDCAECLSTKLGYACTMPCASELASCGAK